MKKPKHVKLSKNNILILPHYLYKYFLKYLAFFLKFLLLKIETAEKRSFITGSHKQLLMKNKKFNNFHKDKRAFVIVNGPSLIKQDMSLIKDDIKYVVTGFFKHEIISDEWQPNYYSFLDENKQLGIRALITKLPSWLPINSFGTVILKSKVEMSMAIVPAIAILSKSGVDKVFVIDKNNIVSERIVELGSFLDQGKVEVLKGLNQGDNIVTLGSFKLYNGQKVQYEH